MNKQLAIVEDDADVRAILQRSLSADGYAVTALSSGDGLEGVLAAVGAAEAHACGAKRRRERLEVIDAEGDVVGPAVETRQSRLEDLGVIEGEDLEVAFPLAEEAGADAPFREVGAPRDLQPERLAGGRDGRVEVADDHTDVVEGPEHRRRSYTDRRDREDTSPVAQHLRG